MVKHSLCTTFNSASQVQWTNLYLQIGQTDNGFFFSTLGQCLIILIISLALVAAIQMNVSDQYIHYFWHCELDPKLTFIHYSLLNLCMQLNDIPIKPPSFSTQIKKAFMDTKNMLQISKSIKAEQYGTIKPISPLF